MLKKYFRCPCTCVLIVSHYSCPHAQTNDHCLHTGRKSLTVVNSTLCRPPDHYLQMPSLCQDQAKERLRPLKRKCLGLEFHS